MEHETYSQKPWNMKLRKHGEWNMNHTVHIEVCKLLILDKPDSKVWQFTQALFRSNDGNEEIVSKL